MRCPRIIVLPFLLFSVLLQQSARAAGGYRNFTVSVYSRVYEVRQMSDLNWLEPRWNELSRQVKVDSNSWLFF